MIRTVSSVRILQAVAVIAGLAVLLWSLGLPSLRFADAANLTNVSDTLTDSAPNVVSNHTIVFTLPSGGSGVGVGESITITFPSSTFDLSNIDEGDVDLATTTGDFDLVPDGTETGFQFGVATTSNTIQFTSDTATIAAGATITVEVGDNATFGGTGNGQIVNPASSTYEISISTTAGDTGTTRVVILDNVLVSASVDTTFTFSIAGVGAGDGSETVRGATITGTTTATGIPFGLLASGTATTTAQDLTVETNASQGYVVTAQVDGTLISSTGADIDGFDDGTYSDVPAAWSSPSADVDDENTWGHWGITSEDGTTTRSTEFTDSLPWIGPTTTARVVMSHDGPADGTTQGVGVARIGFRAEITSLQEAGNDYEANLTYIATPTF